MKKLLLIFMLVMLPLQTTWAVVGTYCQQKQESCADACDSRVQEEPAYSVLSVDQAGSAPAALEHQEHSCQAPVVPLMSSFVRLVPSFGPSPVPLFHEALLSLPTFSERPERPQWRFLA